MAQYYMLIKWNDINDKVLNDPSKFVIIHELVTSPSLQGLDPDLEYFAERIPYEYPVIDIRLAYVRDNITMTNDIETSTGCRYYDRIYQVIERPLAEKLNSIDDVKNQANFGVFPYTKHLEYLAMYAAIIRRELKNQALTPAMINLRDKVEAKITRIWKNHITANTKKEAATAGNPIELDTDWQTNDPENE
jgi:hypothetical protein